MGDHILGDHFRLGLSVLSWPRLEHLLSALLPGKVQNICANSLFWGCLWGLTSPCVTRDALVYPNDHMANRNQQKNVGVTTVVDIFVSNALKISFTAYKFIY